MSGMEIKSRVCHLKKGDRQVSEEKIIKAAQERGINIAEDDDGGWHGTFIYDGQEYSLDNDDLEALGEDMTSLADILESDSYTVDYNEDLDRYMVSVVGFDEPFAAQRLADAYQQGVEALNRKLEAQEAERKAREEAAKPKAEEKPKRGRRPTNGPEPSAPVAASATVGGDLEGVL